MIDSRRFMNCWNAQLQQQIDTPVCLDESVKSVRDFETALRLGSCKVLNIKYGRVGGLSVAIRLHDMARDAGIPCWVGGMLESAIGAGVSIELATLPNFTYPNDLGKPLLSQGLTDRRINRPPSAFDGTGTPCCRSSIVSRVSLRRKTVGRTARSRSSPAQRARRSPIQCRSEALDQVGRWTRMRVTF
jgi:hypothetical protein